MTITDHAAEARRLLEVTAPFQDQHLEVAMTSAQVHATLALVEQQRIANLIALSQATNPDGSRVSPGALTHPVDEYSVAINDDIKKGLGL